MEPQNPYSPPKAKVAAPDAGYGEIRVFSVRGRLGRLRYIGYSIGLPFVIGILIGMAGGAVGAVAGPAAMGVALMPIVLLLGYGAMLVTYVLLSIQRAHDFDKTGWLAILAFVPLINLLFWIIPGSNGENRFGRKPPPNGVATVLIALILPLIFVIGVVAAIAIPAYQQYLHRAASEQSR